MEKDDLKNFLVILSGFKNVSSQERRKITSLLKRDLMIDKEETSIDFNINSVNKENKQNTESSTGRILSTQHHRIGLGDTEYIDPHNLQYFLRSFNQDDILKYTCHLIDADEAIKVICEECNTNEYDYFKHIEIIKKRYKDLLDTFKKQNIQPSTNMATLINVYLTGEDLKGKNIDKSGNLISWSSNRISINWNSEDLRQWAKGNPHIIPNPGMNIKRKQRNSGFYLNNAIKSEIDGSRIKSFSELVIFFKNQFHIRKDNSLYSIVKKTNEKLDYKNVDISFLENKFIESVELFTDVDKIIQAYKKIIYLCVQQRKEQEATEPIKIELSFYDDGTKSKYFCIHHKNSIYGKDLISTKQRIGKDQSELIRNQINGLCDLYLKAKFENGQTAMINLWDKNKQITSEEIEKDFEGVKYILKF